MGRVTGKVALISGGARGIGAADASLLIAEDTRVVIGDIRDDEGSELAHRLGPGTFLGIRSSADAIIAAGGGPVPLGRRDDPADVANFVLFLASDESSYATGAEFVMDGGTVQNIRHKAPPVQLPTSSR
jgi:NAD(P)-dependent dehydrogenase (short-subunit alcohol dehydrogenase family)